MIYTVTFNPAIDYIVALDSPLQLGAIHRSRGEAYELGGKGINVSRVLHSMGIKTTALGFIAGFTGQALEKGLQDMGVSTDFIHLDQGMTRINVKIKAGCETDINGQGPVITNRDLQQLYARLDQLT